jgi:hypothetical protein
MISRIGRTIFVLLLVLGLNCLCFAQPGSNPNGGGAPGTAPISGIEILIGLGGLLGAKKIFDFKRKHKG